MRVALRALVGLVVLLVVGVIALWALLPGWTDRTTSGEIEIAALNAPVRVVRDANAVPYIYAESMPDALRAQGFVAAQDRLFQLEIAKRAATGTLAEVLGAGPDEAILKLDREARVIGFYRVAGRQEAILNEASRMALTSYLEGLNAYILNHADEHPLEFVWRVLNRSFGPRPNCSLSAIFWAGEARRTLMAN